MSFRGPKLHLEDILSSIDEIHQFIGKKSFEEYQSNSLLRSAVERQFQIVSEAAIRLGEDADELCPGPDWSKIRGMGNLLRHEYHRVNDEIIWKAIHDYLPLLRQDVVKALAQF